jgi:hypothetical protein
MESCIQNPRDDSCLSSAYQSPLFSLSWGKIPDLEEIFSQKISEKRRERREEWDMVPQQNMNTNQRDTDISVMLVVEDLSHG